MTADERRRTCDECRLTQHPGRIAQVVTINAHTGALDTWRKLCPRCARDEHRRRRHGQPEAWAREVARALVCAELRAPAQILWIQQGPHRWALICRPRRPPPNPTETAQ